MSLALKYSDNFSTSQNISEVTQNSNHIFKTIGEVSSEIGVPPYVLRFWESKFFIIKPHKRKGGHRYYSLQDVEKIKQIKKLLYEEGFTIKGAKKFLREKKPMFFVKDQQSLFGEVAKPEIASESTSKTVTYIRPQLAQVQPEPKVVKAEMVTNSADNNHTIPNNKPKIDPKSIESFINKLESVKELLR